MHVTSSVCPYHEPFDALEHKEHFYVVTKCFCGFGIQLYKKTVKVNI